ncbi:MAG: hypothetical protein Q8901_00985 [Candidatus Phytoplasma stylosanthis]|nr:hypothetical protein [Candidatus Phytoplasma stylosanthis]
MFENKKFFFINIILFFSLFLFIFIFLFIKIKKTNKFYNFEKVKNQEQAKTIHQLEQEKEQFKQIEKAKKEEIENLKTEQAKTIHQLEQEKEQFKQIEKAKKEEIENLKAEQAKIIHQLEQEKKQFKQIEKAKKEEIENLKVEQAKIIHQLEQEKVKNKQMEQEKEKTIDDFIPNEIRFKRGGLIVHNFFVNNIDESKNILKNKNLFFTKPQYFEYYYKDNRPRYNLNTEKQPNNYFIIKNPPEGLISLNYDGGNGLQRRHDYYYYYNINNYEKFHNDCTYEELSSDGCGAPNLYTFWFKKYKKEIFFKYLKPYI